MVDAIKDSLEGVLQAVDHTVSCAMELDSKKVAIPLKLWNRIRFLESQFVHFKAMREKHG